MALEDNGRAAVTEKIWVEPTGEAFNSISLEPGSGRPLNPMINAGAIAATSLVEGKTTRQKMNRILDTFARYTGRKMEVDKAVYESESETGHRNRAIAYMLRNFGIIQEDPIPSLEAYFMQCSILVNCRDLGMIAATLANGGINPATGSRAVVSDYVENMLSVMGSCGMYDAAGEWIYSVGMPAKSGVAGGILAVLPGQLGIGVFSPPLDSHGNSVRGVKVCRELSRRLCLHMFHASRGGRAAIRHKRRGGETLSNRLRLERESKVIQVYGGSILAIDLQGDLVFSSAEFILRETITEAAESEHVILNYRHVQGTDLVAANLLCELATRLVRAGKTTILSGTRHLPVIAKIFKKEMPAAVYAQILWIQDFDLALEHCENVLIGTHADLHHSGLRAPFSECELVQGLASDDLTLLQSLCRKSTFSAEQVIIQTDEIPADLFFLIKGKVSAWLDSRGTESKRVATFTPGMVFGEMALLDRSKRAARVVADTDVECLCLPLDALDNLHSTHPSLVIHVMQSLASLLSRRLRKANTELSTLYQSQ